MEDKMTKEKLRVDLARELKLARAQYRRSCKSGDNQRRSDASHRLEQAEFAAGILIDGQVRAGATWTWKENL